MSKIRVAYILTPDAGLFAFETVRGLVTHHDHHTFEPTVVIVGGEPDKYFDESISERSKIVHIHTADGDTAFAKGARLVKLLGWIGRARPHISGLFPDDGSFYLGAPSALVGYPTVYHFHHDIPPVDSPFVNSPGSRSILYRAPESGHAYHDHPAIARVVTPVFGHAHAHSARTAPKDRFSIALLVTERSVPRLTRVFKGLAGVSRRLKGRTLAVTAYIPAGIELAVSPALDEAILSGGLGDIERVVVDHTIPESISNNDLLLDPGSSIVDAHFVLKATAARIPILALADSFGSRLIVNFDSGRTIAPDSSFRIADTILMLIESPDNRVLYAENAFARMHITFDPRRTTRIIEDTYRSLAEARGR